MTTGRYVTLESPVTAGSVSMGLLGLALSIGVAQPPTPLALLAVPILLTVPGFVVFSSVERRIRPDRRAGFVAVVASSIVISCLFLLLASGVAVAMGEPRLVVVSVLVLLPFCSQADSIPRLALSRADLLVTGGFVAVLVAYVSLPHLLSTRVTLSYHGPFHASVVEGVLRNGIPPTNPGFAWHRIRTYWPFHLLVGGLTAFTGLNPLRVILVENLVSLAVVVLVAVELARRLPGESSAPLGGVFLAFGMNGVGAFYLLRNGIRDAVWSGSFTYGSLYARYPHSDPVRVFLAKFMNVSGFPLGVAVFAAALLFFVRARERGSTVDRWLVGTACVLAFYVHATTALFAIVGLGVASIAWITSGHDRDRRTLREWVMVWTAVAAVCLPLYLQLSGIGTGGPGLRLGFYPANFWEAEFTYLLVGPAAIYGAVIADRARSAAGASLIAVAAVLFVLPAFVELPAGNSYKAIYLLAIPMGALSASGAARFLSDGGPDRQLLVAVLVVLLLVNPVLLFSAGDYTSPEWAGNDRYRFAGDDVRVNGDPAVNRMLDHVESELPRDSALIASEGALREIGPGNETAPPYVVSAMTGRSQYFVDVYSVYVRYEETGRRGKVKAAILNASRPVPDDAGFDGPLYVLTAPDRPVDAALSEKFANRSDWERAYATERLVLWRYDGTGSGS